MSDLAVDPDFDVTAYPDDPDDYSLQVIRIAESTNDTLILYVYQPCQKTTPLVATEVNMSLSKSTEGTELYHLRLLSSYDVFFKYKVDGITVSDEITRYYNITSIYRKWDKDLDGESGTDNTIDYVAFPVGKLYTVTTINDDVVYGCDSQHVVQILNPYHDFLRYSDGWFPTLWTKNSDCHYVAFATDWEIDTLKSATLYYVRRDYNVETGVQNKTTCKDTKVNGAVVKAAEKVYTDGDGWFGTKYSFSQIESVESFRKNVDLSKAALKGLEGSQWVFCFLVTEDVKREVGWSMYHSYTRVSEVTVLSLEFVSSGRLYNLGAVSDRVTGDDIPGNTTQRGPHELTSWEKFMLWIKKIMSWLFDIDPASIPDWMAIGFLFVLAIVLILFVILITPFLPLIVSAIWSALKAIGHFLWWLISAPFRLIVHLVAGGDST